MTSYDKTRFHWMILPIDFFDRDEIVWLEEQPEGCCYVILYLKLCLKSLKQNGVLIREVGKKKIPYTNELLAKLLGEDVSIVDKGIELLKEVELIEVLENGALYFTNLECFIGDQSKGAYRKQLQRRLNEK